jgi:predicted PurR-regulated permease PerM
VTEPRVQVELTVSNRTLLRLLAVSTAFLLVAWLLWEIRDVLQMLLVAGFLALALNPAVTWLELRGWRRGRAVAAVFVLTLVLVGAVLTVVFAPLYEEVRRFADDIPGYIDELRRSRLLRELDARYDILAKLQEQATTLPARLPGTAGAFLGFAGAIFSAVFKALTVLFLTVFLLLELPAIGRSILSLLAPPTAARTRALTTDINATVARYVVGALVIATIAGTTTLAASSLLGVPFPVVMAVLVALFDLIPLVGATIGGACVVAVAFTAGLVPGLAMLAIQLGYQQVENNLLQPLVMRRSVNVSGFTVLLAVLIGSSLLGVLGALLAIPVAGSVQIGLREVLESRRARVGSLPDPVPEPVPESG